MSAFFATDLWPFTLAAGLMVALCVIEGLALLIGMSTAHWGMDGGHGDADAHAPDSFVGNALGWLHFGKVPLLVILVIFLTTFAVTGFIFQFMARAMIGGFLPPLGAAALALVAAVFGVRIFGGALAKMIPKDETTAVSDQSLVGRVGTIVIGTARAGRPAEARIRDEHGATHYVMVEPEEADQTFAAGASVLLVRHLSGRRFQAIHNPKPELL